jgi:hypothetical protein
MSWAIFLLNRETLSTSGVSKTSGTSGNSSADSQFISLSNDIKELRADLQAQIDSLDVRVTALENP